MDLIYAGRYTEVCDYTWEDYANPLDTIEELPSGIWYVDTASIPQFFSSITNMYNRKNKYVVVSPSCDFGVCLQAYNHPAMDFEKWVSLQATPKHGYDDLHMAARIKRDRCNETDKYSIKCWSYTEATFPEIPDNVVKWFVCNCEINNEKMVAIPLGVQGNKNDLDSVNLIDIRRKLPTERNKLLYINFQFYTTDRMRLYYYFKNNYGDLVTCKQQCSFDEYLNDLATHKFVLCPTGNGLDCYRTLETSYMGAVPIVENNRGALAPYKDLAYPIVAESNMYAINPYTLDTTYKHAMDTFYSNGDNTNIDKVLWPYWENRIEACRSEL